MIDRAVQARVERNTVVSLAGEYDLARRVELHDAIVVGTFGPVVTVDCGGVTFMDCAGLGALLDAATTLERARCLLALRNVPRPVSRLIGLTRTADRFPIIDLSDAATR